MKKYLVAYKSPLWGSLLYKTSLMWSTEKEDAKKYLTLRGARIARSALLRDHLAHLENIELEEVSGLVGNYVVLDSETCLVL